MGVTEVVYAEPPHSHLQGRQFNSLFHAVRDVNLAFGLSPEHQGGFEAYVVAGDARFDWSLVGTGVGYQLVKGVRTPVRFSPLLATAG
eukprot:5153591-Prymnesium_polylepis.1